MRHQHMGCLHTIAFIVFLFILIIAFVIGRSKTVPMLIYDESEIYSCPEDYSKNAAWEMPEREAFSIVQDKHYYKFGGKY